MAATCNRPAGCVTAVACVVDDSRPAPTNRVGGVRVASDKTKSPMRHGAGQPEVSDDGATPCEGGRISSQHGTRADNKSPLRKSTRVAARHHVDVAGGRKGEAEASKAGARGSAVVVEMAADLRGPAATCRVASGGGGLAVPVGRRANNVSMWMGNRFGCHAAAKRRLNTAWNKIGCHARLQRIPVERGQGWRAGSGGGQQHDEGQWWRHLRSAPGCVGRHVWSVYWREVEST